MTKAFDPLKELKRKALFLKENNVKKLKNRWLNDSCIVLGLGSSVNLYKDSGLFNLKKIGVNNADSQLDIDLTYDIECRPNNDWNHRDEWVSSIYSNVDNADYYVDFFVPEGEFDFSVDKVAFCHSSIIGALWLAIYQGCNKIYMVGADFCFGLYNQRFFWDRRDYVKGQWYAMSEDYVKGERLKNGEDMSKDSMSPFYNLLRTKAINVIEKIGFYCVENNIKLYNLSPYIKYANMENV